MAFSICVRERAGDGANDYRFGVAVTTRLSGVGRLCPFASGNGAIATRGPGNADLGRRGLGYVDEELAIDDALRALLNADGGAGTREMADEGGG